VRIVGDRKKFSAFAPVVEDIFPGCGPLGGIQAALCISQNNLNLILAVDMPFISPALLKFLASDARQSEAVVTVPRAARGWQPLCAIYRKVFAESAESALRAGHYKIDSLFARVTTRVIEEDDLAKAGFAASIFQNVNTPEDLAELRSSTELSS
jgi:molybdopterin-guanine dinucleotide biosynthesis protein A